MMKVSHTGHILGLQTNQRVGDDENETVTANYILGLLTNRSVRDDENETVTQQIIYWGYLQTDG